MRTEEIIRNLNYTIKKHSNDRVFTGQTNISAMCKDILPRMEQLKAYEDAEEQGLLPRFHLGDEFWALRLGTVVKAKVVMLQQKKDGTWKYRFSLEISSTYHDTVDYEEREYCKYFFSTKEEAEQMKGE